MCLDAKAHLLDMKRSHLRPVGALRTIVFAHHSRLSGCLDHRTSTPPRHYSQRGTIPQRSKAKRTSKEDSSL